MASGRLDHVTFRGADRRVSPMHGTRSLSVEALHPTRAGPGTFYCCIRRLFLGDNHRRNQSGFNLTNLSSGRFDVRIDRIGVAMNQ